MKPTRRTVSSGVWFGVGLGFNGLGLTGLLQNAETGFYPYAYLLLFIGTLCWGIAAASWFLHLSANATSEPETRGSDTLREGNARSTPTTRPQPVITTPSSNDNIEMVNVEPAGIYKTSVHRIGYTDQIVLGFGDRHDTHFLGAIASFRNNFAAGHKVVDAYGIRAELEMCLPGHGTLDRFGGYFLGAFEGEHNGVKIEAGGQSRDLLLAVRDEQGRVCVVERASTSHPRLQQVYYPEMGTLNLQLIVRLGMDGDLIRQSEYELSITESDLVLTCVS